MDWSDVEDFLHVAEAGSVTAAARNLGVSQPTLSRRVGQLEESVGVELFIRGRRGLTLTAAGERVREVALRMREAAEELDDAARQGHDRVGGLVRVTSVDARFVTDWVLRTLAPLRTAHPDITLELLIGNEYVDLSRREADIAVRMQRPRDPNLVAKRIGRMSWRLFAAEGYLAQHPPIRRGSDLGNHALLVFESGQVVAQRIWIEREALSRAVVLRSNDADTVVRAVELGYGIGLIPCHVGDANASLRRVLGHRELASIDVWLVTHADLRQSPRIRAVFDLLSTGLDGPRQR